MKSFSISSGNMTVKFKFLLIAICFGAALSTADCLVAQQLSKQTFTTEFPLPTGRPLTLEDYYRIEQLGSASISPNGRWVCYTMSYILEEHNTNRSEVWIVPTAGSVEPKRVTPVNSNCRSPRWMRDNLLMYSCLGSTYYIDVEKPETRPFQDKNIKGGANISPDNKWIVTTKPVSTGDKKKPNNTSDFERRAEERFKGVRINWKRYHASLGGYVPDPRDPAATPPHEIFITPRTGGESKQITKLGLKPSSITWRPDSKTLVFKADAHYRDETNYGRSDLWTVTIEGEVARLTDDKYTFWDPSPQYSPDGRFVAYPRYTGIEIVFTEKLKKGGYDICIVPANGGTPINLTAKDSDLLTEKPSIIRWSPDGKYIYFNARTGGTFHLFRVSVNGGNVEQVTTGERVIYGFSFDKNFTKVAYIAQTFTNLPEIFVANIDGSNERQLTEMSKDFTTEITLSKAERLLFPSYDGAPIEGWLYYPYGYSPDKGPYPMIVDCHGGPHAGVDVGFTFRQQLWAAHGYFVLKANCRGSTGYGKDFMYATLGGGYGFMDGGDMMAGVDYAVKNFPIDEKRLGVHGISYGGYLSNWLITQTDRFSAAVSGRSISNWISICGTGEYYFVFDREFYADLFSKESRDLMIKSSPVTYAGNVTTPTLFIHGDFDQNVPLSQAKEMYLALKKMGVTAEMIIYKGAGHYGWGHWTTVHRELNTLKWFDKYLKNERH